MQGQQTVERTTAEAGDAEVPPEWPEAHCFPFPYLLFFLLSLLQKLDINFGAAALATHIHLYPEADTVFWKVAIRARPCP